MKTMHENRHEITKEPWLLVSSAAVVAGAAIVNDYLKGGREIAGLRSETELLNHEVMNAEQTVIWFVGCMQDGHEAYDNLFELTRNKDINLIVPLLPQTSPDGRIDKDEMCHKILDQLTATGASKLFLGGDSKGLIDAVYFTQYVERTGLSDRFNEIDLLGNASPHDADDITYSRRRLLVGAKILQHFATPNHVKPFFMKRIGHGTTAEATLSETVLAGTDIQQSPVVNPVPSIVRKFTYVRGQYYDSTVFTAQAAKKWQIDTPPEVEFEEYIDYTRTPGTHVGNSTRFYLALELAGILGPKPEESSAPVISFRAPALEAA